VQLYLGALVAGLRGGPRLQPPGPAIDWFVHSLVGAVLWFEQPWWRNLFDNCADRGNSSIALTAYALLALAAFHAFDAVPIAGRDRCRSNGALWLLAAINIAGPRSAFGPCSIRCRVVLALTHQVIGDCWF